MNMKEVKFFKVRIVKRDGERLIQFQCPKCKVWGDIDEDQYEGKVSINHDDPNCGFHRTMNLKKYAETKDYFG